MPGAQATGNAPSRPVTGKTLKHSHDANNVRTVLYLLTYLHDLATHARLFAREVAPARWLRVVSQSRTGSIPVGGTMPSPCPGLAEG